MDEHIEALRLLLSHDEQNVSYQGRYAEFYDVNLHPRPVQHPLPIYVPGQSAESLQRVAKWGLGFMVSASTIEERLEALKPALEEHGRDLSEIDAIAEAELCLAPTHEAAVERYSASRMGQFRARLMDVDSVVKLDWIGTADEVAAKISGMTEKGITHFNAFHIAGDTIEEMHEQMQAFAEEVMPKVGH